MDEMMPETMDGRGARGTEDLELTVEDGHVGVKRRRKLWKNFARFVNAADKVEEQVMEKLMSVQRCTVRQREMIVGPIVEFRKELSARFEEVGRDKWPRADRSTRKEGEENHQDELIWFKEEKERLEARIRECEAEKLRAEKLMRRAQRAVEEERKTSEELSGSLQKVSRELERLRRYGRTDQCFRCGGVGHVVRQCTSRPVQKVDTAKKARKSKMVESVKILGQRRRFEVESGSVVSVMSTGGWERSKRRSSKWEKEVEVLAKPNFRGPPQSGAPVRAKANAGFGQFIRMETENECAPTSQSLKSEERKIAGVDPLFIKRNQRIGVGSRSTTGCPPKAAQVTLGKIEMPQLKEKEKVNRANILSLHPLPFNYDRKVIDEDVWMMLAKCPTNVPTLRSSVLEKPFHEHYLQILKEEEETVGGVSAQILVLTLPGVNSELEKEDINLVATRLNCSTILVIVPLTVDRATLHTWSAVMQAISASIDCILVAAPVQDQQIDWTLESEYAEVMEAMNKKNGGKSSRRRYWECVNKVLEEKGGKKLKAVGTSEKTKHQKQRGRTTQKEVVRSQKLGFPKRKTFKNEPYKKKNTYLPEKR
uniref:CCHC-type domain-containing protein n=1 Tax=Caenorhabditis japonica TaxID=281687 RepID=A0A8R1ID28_CAEJA